MLEVAFRRRQGDFQLDVRFEGPAGITGLFGPSGAGKSTVLHAIAGLARPDQGRISVGGQVLFDHEAGIDVRVHRRRLGCVFQDPRLFPHLDVAANLRYGLPRDRAPGVDFDDLVARLGIAHLLARRPAALSGGEAQRVAIGRALLTGPRLLLLDEPLASLDPGRRAELLPLLAELPQRLGVPILWVSHSMDELLQIADQLVHIVDGRVADAGTVDEVAGRLARELRGASIVAATVVGHEPEAGLTRLDLAGQSVAVEQLAAAPGTTVRLRVESDDVILALTRPTGLSAQNVFEATVVALETEGGHVAVHLDVGVPLVAIVSHRAVRTLELAPGKAIFALVKALSLRAPGLYSM